MAINRSKSRYARFAQIRRKARCLSKARALHSQDASGESSGLTWTPDTQQSNAYADHKGQRTRQQTGQKKICGRDNTSCVSPSHTFSGGVTPLKYLENRCCRCCSRSQPPAAAAAAAADAAAALSAEQTSADHAGEPARAPRNAIIGSAHGSSADHCALSNSFPANHSSHYFSAAAGETSKGCWDTSFVARAGKTMSLARTKRKTRSMEADETAANNASIKTNPAMRCPADAPAYIASIDSGLGRRRHISSIVSTESSGYSWIPAHIPALDLGMRPLGTSAGISQRILSGAADGPRQRRRSSRWIQSIAATGTSMAAASEGDGYGVSLLSSQGFGDDSSLSRDERYKASIVDMDAGLSDPTSVASKPRKTDTSGKVAIERGDMHESSVLWMHSAYCEKEQRQQQPTQAPRGSAFMSGETSDKGRAKSSILQGAGSVGSSDFADKSRYMFYSSQTDAVFSSSLVKPAYGDLGIDALIDMVLESGANQAGNGSGVRGACFWLDIAGASAQEVADLSDIFELHPLSTQDIVSGCPRDKIDVFGNYAFIVYSSMLHGAGSGRLSSDYGKSSGSSDIAQWTGEPMHWHQADKCPGRSCRSGAGGSQMCIVMRGNYVVTFHCGHQRPVVRRVLDRLDAMKRAALAVDAGDGDADGNGGIEPMLPYTKEVPLSGLVDFPAYVVYAILDEITDQLSPEMLAIEQHVDAIDELVLVLSHNEHENMLQRMGEQRRRILTTWQVVQPKAEIVDALAQLLRTRLWTGSDELAEEVAQYLGDVHAHLAAAVGTCTRAEAVLSRSHANYLAKISLELSRATFDSNSTTERWTMLGTIVVPINIVTSFLGVNLKVPGQDRDDTLNFFIVMACMVVYAAATLAFWRWRRII